MCRFRDIIMVAMTNWDIMSEEFFAAASAAMEKARLDTLKAGVPVFYRAANGLEVKEMPDGRIFEIRYIRGAPRDGNYEILRELSVAA